MSPYSFWAVQTKCGRMVPSGSLPSWVLRSQLPGRPVRQLFLFRGLRSRLSVCCWYMCSFSGCRAAPPYCSKCPFACFFCLLRWSPHSFFSGSFWASPGFLGLMFYSLRGQDSTWYSQQSRKLKQNFFGLVRVHWPIIVILIFTYFVGLKDGKYRNGCSGRRRYAPPLV